MMTNNQIAVQDLILDPNNPRFVHDFREENRIAEEDLVSSDASTLARFSVRRASGKARPEITYTSDLFDSIKNRGYQRVDQVVARRIAGTDKFLVVEGNRRVSTVKKMLNMLDPNSPENPKDEEERTAISKIEPTLRQLPVYLVGEDGASKEQVEEEIDRILGIRHHGSLKEWEPLPRAYNLFNTYLRMTGQTKENFTYISEMGKALSENYAVKSADVRDSIKAYVAFLQVDELAPNAKRYFTLLSEAILAKGLRSYYFQSDKNTFRLDQDSVENLISLCQFQERGTTMEKQLIKDVPEMRRFNTLITKIYSISRESTREAALSIKDRFLDLENDENREFLLEHALDEVTELIAEEEWLKTVKNHLKIQEEKLLEEDFHAGGNDLMWLTKLKRRVRRMQAIVDIEKEDG